MNRYDAILDAALRIFAEYGSDGTSMAAIADEVGITKGSLYHYFSGKAEILEAVLDGSKFKGEAVREVLLDQSVSLEERLRRIGMAYLTLMKTRPYWSLAMLRESLGVPRNPAMARVKKRFHDHLQARIDAVALGIEKELGASGVSSEEAQLLAAGFFHSLNSFWLMTAHIANAVPSEEECEAYIYIVARQFSRVHDESD